MCICKYMCICMYIYVHHQINQKSRISETPMKHPRPSNLNIIHRHLRDLTYVHIKSVQRPHVLGHTLANRSLSQARPSRVLTWLIFLFVHFCSPTVQVSKHPPEGTWPGRGRAGI